MIDDGYEWDPNKNRINRRKHGIGFEEAATIFEGPVLTADDPGLHDEVRERSYGLVKGVVVVCVVHTDRNGRTRIISARKATSYEREAFDAHLRQARN